MIRIVELQLTDFMAFKHVVIKFNNRGLYSIRGHNQKGGDSNGSGKSSIIAGIVWSLFGKTHTGVTGKDVVRWGCQTCTARLVLTDGQRKFHIVRSPTDLDFFIEGKEQAGHKRDKQELINTTLGTDYSLFTTFNVFTKQWYKFITEVGDAEKKKLFKNILRLEKLDEAADRAKKIYTNLTVQANKTEIIIDQLKKAIPETEKELETYKDYAKNESVIREQTIQEIETKKELLRPKDNTFQKDLANIEKVLEELKKATGEDKLEYLNIQLQNLNGLIFHCQKTIEDYDTSIKNFQGMGPECQTCGQSIPPRHRTAHRRRLEILRNDIVNENNSLVDAKNKIHEEMLVIEKKMQEVATTERTKSQIELQIWEDNIKKEKYNEFCEMSAITINKLMSAGESYNKIIEQTESKLEKLKNDLNSTEETFTSLKREIDLYNYIVWLYSRRGVISLIINKCFNRLKFLANKYLRQLSSEGFKIDISPQKELKSGELREEIDLYILDGDRKIPYNSLSAGQQQRINVALLMALHSWGREIGACTVDCLLLDEILDLSLGEKGQEDVLEMIITAIRPVVYHVFLITHKNLLGKQFDNEIYVMLEGGVSKIVT